MKCADFERLLSDYLDGLLDATGREEMDRHRQACRGCDDLARDAAAAVTFLADVPGVEPPPELITRILYRTPQALVSGQHKRGVWKWFTGWMEPVLQPRFVMGMAMTILSFSMVGRIIGLPQRQLKPEDLRPAQIIMGIEDRLARAWDRAVKYYENLRLVYQIQTQLQEWSVQEEEDRRAREADAAIVPARGKAEAEASKAKSFTPKSPGQDGRKQP